MALHPIVAKIIAGAYRQGHGRLHQASLEEVRGYFRKFSTASPYSCYQDHPIKNGVRIRFHQSEKSTKPLPVLFYLRANAYVTGNISDADLMCYHLAKHLNWIVAALEVRLSPEAKFPLPFEDVVACIHYVMDNHPQLNIDLKKTAIWGESSGGNLACALCLYLKKEKVAVIKNQVLFYPMLDYSQTTIYPSKALYGNGYMLDTVLSDWFLSQYVTSKQDYLDERVSPLLADNFENLPVSLIVGAQCDPMRDEAASLVEKLSHSKVRVQSMFLPGLTHGFLWYSNRVPGARDSLYYAAGFLKEQFLI